MFQIIIVTITVFFLFQLSGHIIQFSSVAQSDSLRPHESQHARPPCPTPTPGVYSNSCPSSRWCHPAISSSVVPFSSCPQSLPASGSFTMSQLVAWGGQSTGVSASASVLPINTQDWSPLGWTGWVSLQSKGHMIIWILNVAVGRMASQGCPCPQKLSMLGYMANGDKGCK